METEEEEEVPFVVAQSPVFGRCLRTRRALEQGEVIIQEEPIGAFGNEMGKGQCNVKKNHN